MGSHSDPPIRNIRKHRTRRGSSHLTDLEAEAGSSQWNAPKVVPAAGGGAPRKPVLPVDAGARHLRTFSLWDIGCSHNKRQTVCSAPRFTSGHFPWTRKENRVATGCFLERVKGVKKAILI